jgi:hypothetical protein
MPVYLHDPTAWSGHGGTLVDEFKPRRDIAAWFLATLYGPASEGFLVVAGSSPIQGGFGPRLVVPAVALGDAADFAATSAEDTWIGVCLRGVHPGVGKIGAADIAYVFPGLWADLDFRTDDGAHKGQKALWPESEADCFRIIEQLGPDLQPSVVVHSGHGLQPYWLLDQPFVLDKDDPTEYDGPYNGLKHELAEALVRRLQTALAEASRTLGYAAPDNVANLARVMRLPGSYNRKVVDSPKPVRLAEPPTSRRYTLDELDALLPKRGAEVGKASRSWGLSAGQADSGGGDGQYSGQRFSTQTADVELVAEGCAWMRHVRDDAVGLPYPEWVAGLTILTRCEDGQGLAHEWSMPDPRYDPHTVDDKAREAFTNMGPRTCAWVEQETQGEYCHTCPHWGKIKSPIVLGDKPVSSPTAGPDRDDFDVGDCDVEVDMPRIWEAIRKRNDRLHVFRTESSLVRVRQHEAGHFIVDPVTKDTAMGLLGSALRFTRTLKSGVVPAVPPDWARTLAVTDFHRAPIPYLRKLVGAPILGPDGTISLEWGYDPPTRTFYAPAVGLEVPEVPEKPTEADVAEARRLVEFELLGDFSIRDEAEMAGAWCLLLLPFVRGLVAGPTPLHLIEKPVAASGASLLIRVLCGVFLGYDVPLHPLPRDQEELRKLITTELDKRATYVAFDNVTRLEGSHLAAVLTATMWSDRILGQSKSAELANEAIWIATGNNPLLSKEIARRVVRCRLDPKMERPQDRPPESFRHSDLEGWAREHRGQLVWAALTLCRNWHALGRPKPDSVLASYESWSYTVGGILEAAGVPGFLANRVQVTEDSAVEEDADLEFYTAWWSQKGDAPTPTRELTVLAMACGVDLGRGDPGRGLGRHLGANKDRVFTLPSDGPTVVVTKSKTHGYWLLEKVS